MKQPTNAVTASGTYAKKVSAKATVGEAQAMAKGEALPALMAARWALAVSVLALTLSVISALVVVLR